MAPMYNDLIIIQKEMGDVNSYFMGPRSGPGSEDSKGSKGSEGKVSPLRGDEYIVSVTGLPSRPHRHSKHDGELAACRRLFPLWCLTAPPFPRLRGEGGGEATKGGALFPRPPGRLYGFYKLAAKPPTTTLTAEGRVKLKPL